MSCPDARPFGFLNALKPPGISSTAFGSWVRRLLGAQSVGHWGTLDPAAAGVLVLAVGKASRLLPYLPRDDKAYVFELRLGSSTDTGDSTGRLVQRSPVPHDWRERLGAALPSFVGFLDQLPPMYSAVKVAGRPLYASARAGRAVERSVRRVQVFTLRVLGTQDMPDARARCALECSSGTYVRTLCEQIGERIGVAAHMGMLVRTRAGPFGLADAVAPSAIARDAAAALVDPASALALPLVDLDAQSAHKFVHGNDAAVEQSPATSGGGLVLVRSGGRLIGVGKAGATLSPVRVLAEAGEKA